jgi:hypothetical protein
VRRDAPYEDLHLAYEDAIEFNLQNNYVRADHLQKIVDAFVVYGKSIKLDGEVDPGFRTTG